MTPEQIEQHIGHRLPEHSMNLLLQLIAEKVQPLLSESAQWRSVFGHLGTPDEIGNEWIAIQQENERLKNSLSVVRGCFEAAESEGLSEALANTTDECLKDLVERRLMYALLAAKGEYHGG